MSSGNSNATVVLDIKKLKEEMAKKNDLTAQAEALDFAVKADEAETSEAEPIKVILFEFGAPLFESEMKNFPPIAEFVLCKDVKELSQHLKNPGKQVVMFNYNGDPKAVNTLTKQIKEKFQNTKTVIIAKNLAPDKVKIHKESVSGANEYINLPFTHENIAQVLKNLA
jgi:hypothetical protein